ncbi:multiubiquitin domain-containing protein [Caulobacter sp.]|uniref:multiubiquitin domain-containing protein n=1 Tax=Caulobacter sp. TaxID=78 RepID=UPI003BB0F5C9
MNDQRPHGHEDKITIKDDDGDVVVIRDRSDDVAVEVTVRHEGGREIIEVDIVDIEECGRENRCPPTAHRYKVKIDGMPYIFDKRHVTGRELLERASKTPVERYELEKRMHGGHYISVPLDEPPVDLGEPGIEVFETFPLDETEG